MEGLLFKQSCQREAWDVTLEQTLIRIQSQGRHGKSDLGSRGKKCTDAEQEAGAVMGEEIRAHWQKMLNSITSKAGRLKGRRLEDAELQPWDAS